MKTELVYIYAKLRANPVTTRCGFNASDCLSQARTIARFEELAAQGLVRITSEDEWENYFSVYGKAENERDQKNMEDTISRLGCVCVMSEYRDENGEWQMADSIGMCVYEHPESPFENCYVTDLMSSAIAQADKVAREPAERAYWESRDTVTV